MIIEKPVVTVTINGAPVFTGSPNVDGYLDIYTDGDGVPWLVCRVASRLAQLEVGTEPVPRTNTDPTEQQLGDALNFVRNHPTEAARQWLALRAQLAAVTTERDEALRDWATEMRIAETMREDAVSGTRMAAERHVAQLPVTQSLVATKGALERVTAERDALQTAIAKVNELHHQDAAEPVWCAEDGFGWPCATARAAAMGGNPEEAVEACEHEWHDFLAMDGLTNPKCTKCGEKKSVPQPGRDYSYDQAD